MDSTRNDECDEAGLRRPSSDLVFEAAPFHALTANLPMMPQHGRRHWYAVLARVLGRQLIDEQSPASVVSCKRRTVPWQRSARNV